MPGPYSSDRPLGAHEPPFDDTHPSEPLPAPPPAFGPAGPPPATYPWPPPLPYPKPRRRRLVIGAALALLLAAALTAVILRGPHGGPTTPSGPFSDAIAKTAIQGYLDALEHRDFEAIGRNTLCGIYDAVRDRRTDQALAKLSSDAFRKQFAEAKVTTIDKIVYWSDYQAQVLFSMRVQRPGGSETSEVQGVAQLLSQHNQVLVCSYVLRTAGTY
ncbi:membrane protein [Mycobacterium cookii]|uniref:DUF8174 domain-containing protein n=1 Tax=Mycobacterium cookii TaxID=1775 RepID=A0A7I7KSY2_9MYCO|nr:hypothetical protein [Mycobacterium cookii]MCV7330025.1 hypothetical protein [Mycobacterium cookii]BBX45195.1 hypothetical protein MCOO_12100 [Mycobacterium cookii]